MWVKYLFRLFICPNFGRPSHFQQTSPLRESTLHKRRQVASAQLKYKQRPLYPTLRTNPFLKVPDLFRRLHLPTLVYRPEAWNKQYVHSTYPHLEKHADDGHHRQSSASKFGTELLSTVGSSQDLESKVAPGSKSSRRLVMENLAESHVRQDLTPSSKVSMLAL